MTKQSLDSHRIAGLTLVETLIYSILVAFMIGGSLVVVYQIIQNSEATQVKISAEEETNFLLRKIAWALTGVDTINSPAVGVSSSTLSINKTNFSQNPLIFDWDSLNLRLQRGAGSPAVLNSESVKVNFVLFEHLAGSGNVPEAVRITLILGGEPATTTIYLRQ